MSFYNKMYLGDVYFEIISHHYNINYYYYYYQDYYNYYYKDYNYNLNYL